MMLSPRGAIDILGHEGCGLDWYLDSVGVPTIGFGQTRSDNIDPQHMGRITVEQAISLFKNKIKEYTDAVDHVMAVEHLDFNQFQYDSLSSACYNFGPGNLYTLCRHRTVEQIGDALMLYRRPPEITARRRGEQTLYKRGVYSNHDMTSLLFPVTANHHPDYHHAKVLDLKPYFPELQAPANAPVA